MRSDPRFQIEDRRLHSVIERCEEKLAAQRVCVLKLSLLSCTVAAELAGARVKVKCRGSTSTYIKSEAYQVPAGGGMLCLIEPSEDAVYEGDPSLRFELCQVHRWRPSTVMAIGNLPLAEVFRDAGLEGGAASWNVQLMSKGALALGSLEMTIRCETGRFDRYGGKRALKAFAIGARPDVARTSTGGKAWQAVVMRVWEYDVNCRKVAQHLQAALVTATALAGTSDHEVSRKPGVRHARVTPIRKL